MPELAQCSYLLRLWREYDEQPWRVILIAVADANQHRHFTTLEECFAFLHAQTATPDETNMHRTSLLRIES